MDDDYQIETLVQPSYATYDEANSLVQFCKTAQAETQNPAVSNVQYDGWQENTSSLMYAISRQRFDEPTGTLQVVKLQDKIVSVAGAYLSDFDEQAVMVGCRAWTLIPYRARFMIGDFILPVQLEWAVNHGADIAIFSFVPYNSWVARMILRASAGRVLRPGRHNAAAYTGWVAHPTLCTIKNVNQIVLYKQLGVEDRVPDLIDIDTKLPNGLD